LQIQHIPTMLCWKGSHFVKHLCILFLRDGFGGMKAVPNVRSLCCIWHGLQYHGRFPTQNTIQRNYPMICVVPVQFEDTLQKRTQTNCSSVTQWLWLHSYVLDNAKPSTVQPSCKTQNIMGMNWK
jgi:hypothetical protein